MLEVRTAPNLTVGYIMGTGDQVPSFIEQLGARVEMIGADGLNVLDVGVAKVIYIALLAMLASVLTSIGSAPLGNDKTSPSIVALGPGTPSSAAPATTQVPPSQPTTPTTPSAS